MITIRKATHDDATLIAEMSRRTFHETFAEHNSKEDMDKFLSVQFSEELLIAETNVESNAYFIAYYNNDPAGYIFLKPNTHPGLASSDALEISRLYSYTSFIGKGVGKALMAAAIDHARTSGKDTIWLGVWEHNQRAIDFYHSFGFEKFSEQSFILGNDVQRDWVMSLGLRSKD
jgi:ribosomal protein S18 acetylase RimI-like enzyme